MKITDFEKNVLDGTKHFDVFLALKSETEKTKLDDMKKILEKNQSNGMEAHILYCDFKRGAFGEAENFCNDEYLEKCFSEKRERKYLPALHSEVLYRMIKPSYKASLKDQAEAFRNTNLYMCDFIEGLTGCKFDKDICGISYFIDTIRPHIIDHGIDSVDKNLTTDLLKILNEYKEIQLFDDLDFGQARDKMMSLWALNAVKEDLEQFDPFFMDGILSYHKDTIRLVYSSYGINGCLEYGEPDFIKLILNAVLKHKRLFHKLEVINITNKNKSDSTSYKKESIGNWNNMSLVIHNKIIDKYEDFAVNFQAKFGDSPSLQEYYAGFIDSAEKLVSIYESNTDMEANKAS
tara:strand:- start:30680 stop:31723 length:1044 start_codon:yes stop_codon:yes gene_type:complete